MSRNIISSTPVTRLNAISANRTEILNKQKEVSQAIQQLIMECNILQREHDKRE
jgi:hypothetical protein